MIIQAWKAKKEKKKKYEDWDLTAQKLHVKIKSKILKAQVCSYNTLKDHYYSCLQYQKAR